MREPKIKNNIRIFIIRLVHSFFALFFIFCLIFIYYSGIAKQRNIWVFLAMVALLFEALVFVINGWQCPLSSLQRKYGDEKGFFGLFLPNEVLPYIPLFFAVFFVIGLVLIFI